LSEQCGDCALVSPWAQAALDTGALAAVVAGLRSDDDKLECESMWAFANATTTVTAARTMELASDDMISAVIGGFRGLCTRGWMDAGTSRHRVLVPSRARPCAGCLSATEDDRVVEVAVQGLENLLLAGDAIEGSAADSAPAGGAGGTGNPIVPLLKAHGADTVLADIARNDTGECHGWSGTAAVHAHPAERADGAAIAQRILHGWMPGAMLSRRKEKRKGRGGGTR
jgi:hypothetical protein